MISTDLQVVTVHDQLVECSVRNTTGLKFKTLTVISPWISTCLPAYSVS